MNKNKYLILVRSFVSLLFLSISAHAQTVWDKKPFQQWSGYEAIQIIIDSPWAKTIRDDNGSYSANIRLHSALPIRQALVRQKQTRMNYNRLNAADKAKIDSDVQEALECPECTNFYIVTLRIIPTDQKALRLLTSSSLDDLKPYVSLANDKGERRELINFIPPKGGGDNAVFFDNAVFYFKRLDERGKPLLTIENKKLYFSVDEKAWKGKLMHLPKVTFEVSKLGSVDISA